jgi:hypothetical protein
MTNIAGHSAANVSEGRSAAPFVQG